MASEERQADDRSGEPEPSRADAVRAAVDQAFQATAGQAQITRERAQELVDELVGAAGRVRPRIDVDELAGRLRDLVDDLRPSSAEEVRELRRQVEDLQRRVEALERGGGR